MAVIDGPGIRTTVWLHAGNSSFRKWGWSGYFVELDGCYQDHIIKRMELAVS